MDILLLSLIWVEMCMRPRVGLRLRVLDTFYLESFSASRICFASVNGKRRINEV